jgi:ABC-type tungstate transport system permease subunit
MRWEPVPSKNKKEVTKMANIRIATTTSVVDSGLFSRIKSAFETAYPSYILVWSPLGSGGAMNAARAGNADIVIAHDRVGEFAFLAERYTLNRQWGFFNYFILVGPATNNSIAPTPPNNTLTLEEAFTIIYNGGSPSVTYVSRGPSGLSGTYVREQQIWRLLLNRIPYNTPYPSTFSPILPPPLPPIPSPGPELPALPTLPGPGIFIGGGGQGMSATLNATSDRVVANVDAYTLVDIGTWYAYLSEIGRAHV